MPRGQYIRTKENSGKNLGKHWKIKDTSKMGLDKIGKPSGAKGKHWKDPEEARKKRSFIMKGRIKSEEHRKRIGNANRGKKHPSMVGNKNPAWRGGITPINTKIRTSSELGWWRKACLERDNFTCQKTGVRGGRLAVHHINNFAEFPELRTSIENGITLSIESHIEFHKRYGRKNNTREQLEEFFCQSHG